MKIFYYITTNTIGQTIGYYYEEGDYSSNAKSEILDSFPYYAPIEYHQIQK